MKLATVRIAAILCNSVFKSPSKNIATSEIANWRLVEGSCTTEERPLAAKQQNNKKENKAKIYFQKVEVKKSFAVPQLNNKEREQGQN